MVGEMFEVFAGSREDGGGQSKGNCVVSRNDGFDTFDGNDFQEWGKKLLTGRGVSEIGGRIRPSANTGLDVVAFSWADFFDDFSRKYKSSPIDGLQCGAKSVDRGGGGQWTKFSGFICGPVGLIGEEGGSEIAEESGKGGGFDQNAGGGIATLPRS